MLAGYESGIEERDLLVIPHFENDAGEEATSLRDRFDVGSGMFTAVLVGKDGGEKFRSRNPIPPQDLFERIDAMPMRRREMREGR